MKKELIEFKKFVDSYNLKAEGIRFKYDHSIRTMKIGNSIAKKLKLNNTEIYMVTLACLLHDLARFDQLKLYNTFNDRKSFDHGDYAVDLIIKNNYLRNYTEDTTYDSAILKSIKYHNKYKIEDCNDIELLFSKIVRDADKIDILLNAGVKKFGNYEINEYEITDKVYECVINGSSINYDDTKNKIDKLILGVAMIYDLNFRYSFEFIKGKGVIKSVTNFIRSINKNKDTLTKINEIETKLEQHIEGMITNG
jgi:HD superfamily phosphohydrolase YqeK